jgi:quercetin dioxygenase-like cupin family protein
MRVVKTAFEDIPKDAGKLVMLPLFGPKAKANAAVDMGYAVFAPGVRSPVENFTSHDGDEFSYIISGSIKCFSGGEPHEAGAGEACHIPAGEPHYSYNDSDTPCSLIYLLVKTV